MTKRPTDVVAITGTGGIGISVARRLGGGRTLVLADADPARLDSVADQLRQEGHDVLVVATDIADPGAVAAFAAQTAEVGPLRALVHTAGISPAQADPATILRVNVIGTALLLDSFLPQVVPGTVGVCVASMAAHTAPPLPADVERQLAMTPTADLASLAVLDPTAVNRASAYAIGKRANQLRVAAASVAWGENGGRVVSVSPGIIATPMGAAELAGPGGAQMRQMVALSAARRIGTPEDIAAAVEFVTSAAASFISGSDLLVDGGAVAGLLFRPGSDA